MAVESFAIGSYIIPMDTTYQNNAALDTGMISAYGLVYDLLDNGIPVKWAIQPGKATIDSTDFTASAQDIQTSAIITGHSYSGGPFIIDSAYATAALPIIQAWQVNHSVTVHQATVAFSAPIAMTLSRAPRIAIEENNWDIMGDYLNDAGIPDSNGHIWEDSGSYTSPDILDHLTIANYGFFTSATDPCKLLKYDIFLSPHTSDGDWSGSDPDEVAARDALDTFLRTGGMLHATCHSVQTIETIVGPFITSAYSTENDGDKNTFTVDQPDFPVVQAVSNPNEMERPGGSVNTWTATYLSSAQKLAHFVKDSTEYDLIAAGTYKGGTGAGKIVYEGGHEFDYKMDEPYTDKDNIEMVYLRYLLDSILFSVGKPRIVLNTSPPSIPTGVPTTVTFSLDNEGGSDAVGASVSITLAPWAAYNADATIPPTSIVGQTLTWDTTALAGNTGPGTILTFTANVTPPVPGFNSAASYTATYDDNFNENYSMNYCVSVSATPGASPLISKTPPNQTVNPNGTVTWTITGGNNGTLPLNAVMVTDTLPAGLTYVSAIPAPSGIAGNVLTWNFLGPIPALTPNFFTITLTALAPPGTTATFINQVNMTGTDTSPASYSVTDTAEVQVVNRPPTVTVTNPNGGELICNDTTITWTASDPDGDPLTYTVEYSSDGGSTYTAIATGLTATSYFWNTSGLPSGSNYLVRVIASDGELTGQDTSDGTFTIDNTPPTVNWVSPADGSFLTTSPYTLEASATDNVGVNDVEFFYSSDGIIYTSIGIDTTPVGNIYSANWEFDTLTPGAYKLKAVATDTCGKISDSIIDVTIDLPPEVEVISPNGGEVICPTGTNITWDASHPMGAPLTYSILYSSDGGSTFTVLVTGLTGTCPCSYFWDTSGLPSGNNYLVKVVATDGILSAEDVSDAPFTIDNTPPALNWVSPVNGSYVRNTITLSATSTDNVGVTGVTFEYSSDGGFIYNLIATVLVPFDSTYATSWDTTAVPDGQYKLRATASDGCNNTTQRVIDVTVDNTPPTVTIVSPPDGSTVFGTVDLVISSQDNECLAKVDLYIDGQLVHTELVGDDTGTDFIYEWDTNQLAEGNHVVRAEATDCGGLTAETENTYKVDNLPDHYTQVLIDGTLEIPELKPNVERIINFEVIPVVETIKLINTIDGTKVIIGGFIEFNVTYVSTSDDQKVHFAHFIRPFLGYILWPDLPLDAELCPVIIIEHEQHHLIDPRTIKKNVVLFIGVRIC